MVIFPFVGSLMSCTGSIEDKAQLTMGVMNRSYIWQTTLHCTCRRSGWMRISEKKMPFDQTFHFRPQSLIVTSVYPLIAKKWPRRTFCKYSECDIGIFGIYLFDKYSECDIGIFGVYLFDKYSECDIGIFGIYLFDKYSKCDGSVRHSVQLLSNISNAAGAVKSAIWTYKHAPFVYMQCMICGANGVHCA